MRRIGSAVLAAAALAGCAAPMPPASERLVLAHRGVHQTFSHENLGRDDCTATRINPPTHAFLENTIPSLQATVALGADIIEVDIHPTTDGDFAVFHDWVVDCRTNGHGVTRELSMAYLRTLDAGYGYTADGGQTFPLRGTGVGLIPNLEEALAAVPNTRVLINFKSAEADEGRLLAAHLARIHIGPDRVFVYGHEAPVEAFLAAAPGFRGFTRKSVRACLGAWMISGVVANVPDDCRNTIVIVPSNYAQLVPRWQEDFVQRMAAVNTLVFAAGPVADNMSSGFDDPAALDTLPAGAGVWTDRVELIGPAVHRR